jgi:hypothetical protein
MWRQVEGAMKFALALLRRFGLFAHKSAHVDPRFDQRLARICTRESVRGATTQGTPRP